MKKKFLIPLLLISLTFGISSVRAENQSNVYTINNFYDYYQSYSYISSSAITDLKSSWTSSYSQLASNYIIYEVSGYVYITGISSNRLRVLPGTYNQLVFQGGIVSGTTLRYDESNSTISSSTSAYSGSYLIYEASTSLIFDGGYTGYDVDKIIIPSYTNNVLDVSYPSYELYLGDEIPTYDKLSSGNYDSYQTIYLSNYSYVALSLKDYEQDSFWTNIYTQGRLCLTPVYNYGMTPRNEVLVGTQVQSCTTEYSSLTPVNVSIVQSDIDNHAIYYVSDYDNLGTIIKVDSRVFDVTYITSQNEDNPQVLIGGRSYPTIPYSQLTDSATISTDNNYISGQVCSVGDVNCTGDVVGIDFNDLWTSPLQLFKTLGTSITSVLAVVTAFIVFLPPTLQAFLYTGFFLVIILGCIKVIL